MASAAGRAARWRATWGPSFVVAVGALVAILAWLAGCGSTGTQATPEADADASAPAPTATATEPSAPSKVCVPGARRCSGTSDKYQLCASDGTRWDAHGCPDGTACVHDGACAPTACTPHASSCLPDGTGYATCDDTGTLTTTTPCAATDVCVMNASTPVCTKEICVPNATSCTADATSYQRCNASGTALGPATSCSTTEVCKSNDCSAATTLLGDRTVLTAASGSMALDPGIYAVAVVDTEATADTDVPFPLTLSGTVYDALGGAPVPSIPMSHRAPRQFPCGTMEVLAHMSVPERTIPAPPNMRIFANVGDTRTFYWNEGTSTAAPRRGVLRAIGKAVNFWEDITDAPQGSLATDAQLQELVRRVDTGVIPRDIALFGPLSDVDGNGHIDVFFTPLLPIPGMVAFMKSSAFFSSTATNRDFGEIIYSAMSTTASAADEAGVLAHEISHLITFGRRLGPFLSSTGPLPSWLLGDTYVLEGMANLAASRSGQTVVYPSFSPEMSLPRLFRGAYLTSEDANGAMYQLGTLAVEYLFDQAGGATFTGPTSLVDGGGKAYIEALTTRTLTGTQHVAPLDGRSAEQWYTDLASALAYATLWKTQKGAALAPSSPLWFEPSAQDASFSGVDGMPFYLKELDPTYPDSPILKGTAWSKRPATMKSGGFTVLTVVVGANGARATLSRPSARAAFLRHKQ